MLNNPTRNTINVNRYNFYPSFSFRVEMPYFSEIPNIDRKMQNYVKNVNIPEFSVDDVIINLVNYEYKFPRLLFIREFSIEFYIDDENNVFNYFLTWYKNMFDTKTSIKKVKSFYEKQIIVYIYKDTGLQGIKYIFNNCYPKNFIKFDLDYNSDDRIISFPVNFVVNGNVVMEV